MLASNLTINCTKQMIPALLSFENLSIHFFSKTHTCIYHGKPNFTIAPTIQKIFIRLGSDFVKRLNHICIFRDGCISSFCIKWQCHLNRDEKADKDPSQPSLVFFSRNSICFCCVFFTIYFMERFP